MQTTKMNRIKRFAKIGTAVTFAAVLGFGSISAAHAEEVVEQPAITETEAVEQPILVEEEVVEQPPVVEAKAPEEPPATETKPVEQPPVVQTEVAEQQPLVQEEVVQQPAAEPTAQPALVSASFTPYCEGEGTADPYPAVKSNVQVTVPEGHAPVQVNILLDEAAWAFNGEKIAAPGGGLSLFGPVDVGTHTFVVLIDDVRASTQQVTVVDDCIPEVPEEPAPTASISDLDVSSVDTDGVRSIGASGQVSLGNIPQGSAVEVRFQVTGPTTVVLPNAPVTGGSFSSTSPASGLADGTYTVIAQTYVDGVAVGSPSSDTVTFTTEVVVPPAQPSLVQMGQSSMCVDGTKPGFEVHIIVDIPEGTGPIVLAVLFGDEQLLGEPQTISTSGQYIFYGEAPAGDLEYSVTIDGRPAGEGYVYVEDCCEDDTNPGDGDGNGDGDGDDNGGEPGPGNGGQPGPGTPGPSNPGPSNPGPVNPGPGVVTPPVSTPDVTQKPVVEVKPPVKTPVKVAQRESTLPETGVSTEPFVGLVFAGVVLALGSILLAYGHSVHARRKSSSAVM